MSWKSWYCAVMVMAVGCSRGPDTEGNVREALEEANMRSVEVQVNEDAKIVHLEGTVETVADRTRAEEIAAAAVGTSGRVLNELTVETLTDRAPKDADDRITEKLDLIIDGDPVLRERDVNFRVSNGMVAITGEVRTAAEKMRVEQLTRAAPGVKDVANGLEIRAEP